MGIHVDEVVPFGEPDVRVCPQCGAEFIRALIRFEYEGQLVGYYPADVCKAGHKFLTQESSRAIDSTLKRRGLWGSEVFGPQVVILGEPQGGVTLTSIPPKRLVKKEQGVTTSETTVTALDIHHEAKVSVDVVTA